MIICCSAKVTDLRIKCPKGMEVKADISLGCTFSCYKISFVLTNIIYQLNSLDFHSCSHCMSEWDSP